MVGLANTLSLPETRSWDLLLLALLRPVQQGLQPRQHTWAGKSGPFQVWRDS